MSKRSKEKSKSRLADWEVTTADVEDSRPQVQDFPRCWWDRSKRGWYTFRDTKGIVAEFAPGVVLKVRRLDPQVTITVAPGGASASGGPSTGGE